MARLLVRLFAVVAPVCALACADPAGTAEEGVRVSLEAEGVRVVNDRSLPIYYFAGDAGALIAALWAPCADPSTCARVPARSRGTVPYDSVAFWTDGSTHLSFNWWHLVPDGNSGWRPDRIRTLSVVR